ncbi:sensor domain-containing phosphodiesterase [Mycolicibacterium sphagni]|uniref:sensor domain-containing phosphodiesterase n=1 Tax=Mycolicibacterium sphagni TaxID=1786 RepID=UPI0021F2771B|nr:EAL domain-containing protein [Mycolicibacterium sphagni]MCV7177961.1 EAL domain-containing protein [Mycolicibacterium sphagni]
MAESTDEVARDSLRSPSVEELSRLDAAATGEGLELVFQPIVSLPEEEVVGYEALARWDHLDDLGAPEAVLARAADTGRQTQLDRLCIHRAIESALAAEFDPDTMLFINSEAVTAHVSRAHDALLARGAERLQIVFELTERGLLSDPPALLRKVAALHADGFAVAFDDVGANLESLALLDVVCPEIIKLDLALVQSLSRYHQARTWSAVLDHHERAGATILAEGIETAEHLDRALALGATLGQGFRFGRPGRLASHRSHRGRGAPRIRSQQPSLDIGSPFDAVAGSVPTRTERKDTVLALSRYIEQQALAASDPPMVLTALQRVEFFTSATRDQYHRLAGPCPLVAVFGHDVPADLGSGVRGFTIDDGDPLSCEWVVLTLGATTVTALIAREHADNADHGRQDGDRLFEVAITNDRTLVTGVARNLLNRML